MKRITFILIMLVETTFAQWTQKANFGGLERNYAVSFSIGTKGYVGTGEDFSGNAYKDLWEYDQATNTWSQKANLPGVARLMAVGFAVGAKGYIGTGWDVNVNTSLSDFYEYDPSTNTWSTKANFAGGLREDAFGMGIGTKGYVGKGMNRNTSTYPSDFWEYNPATNTWTSKSAFGLYGLTMHPVAFSIGTKGYVGTGLKDPNGGSVVTNEFWEYDQSLNTWTQKANVPGTGRNWATGFSIGTKGYIGLGSNGTNFTDFYEWDQATNAWTAVATFPGGTHNNSIGLSIGTKGYVGTGQAVVNYLKDFWELTPSSVSVTTGTITPSTVCAGATVSVPFTIAGSFTVGNIFTAQLSNSAGSFASPVAIGTLSGTTSGTINATIPISTTPSGSGYKIRIVSSNPVITGSSSNITINALPVVSITGLNTSFCINAAPVTLVGSPAGGTFSGPGVSGTTFSPLSSGLGSHTITYSYTNGNGCTNSTSSNVTVNAIPTVSFSGLAGSYTSSDAPATLTGSPAGGVFTGDAISGNVFYPSLASTTNTSNVVYVYTSPSGCVNASCGSTAVSSSVGVLENNIKSSEPTIYPNPADQKFTLEIGEELNNATITIYDASGNTVFSSFYSKLNKTEINTGTLSNGMYLIKISAKGDYIITKKLLIN